MDDLESMLCRKAQRFLSDRRGLRRPQVAPVFRQRRYIAPHDLWVENYLRPRPLAAFNPGAAQVEGKVYLFPRLVFDYYSYASAIGMVELEAAALLAGELPRPLLTRLVLWPQHLWEAVRGCEDPRVMPLEDRFWILYTGVGKVGWQRRTEHKDVHGTVLAFAELDHAGTVRRKAPVGIAWNRRRYFLPNKDSAFVSLQEGQAVLVTRPSLRGLPDLGWRGELDLESMTIRGDSLEPVLAPEPFEYKVGWSTNALPLPDGTFLVGWHGVFREDLSYRNGLARVDTAGRLLALSDYLLIPQGVNEAFGDRPLTLFGNGLLCLGDHLVWVGGVGDYAIGLFIADLQEALSALHPV